MSTPTNLRATGDRIESLIEELRGSADPRIFHKLEELLRLVTELYGAGLSRVLEIVCRTPGLVEELVADDVIASLLLVHQLHPNPLGDRVEAALEKVRPLLAAHGGGVELLDIDEDAAAVRLRLTGSCDGCPSSAVTLQSAVEAAIIEAAPEIVTIDVDAPTPEPTSVPIALGHKPSMYDECPVEMVGGTR